MLPPVVGLFFVALVGWSALKLRKTCQLSNDSRTVLRLQLMPLVNIILISVNTFVAFLISTGSIISKDVNSVWNHIVVALDQLVYLIGFVNWLYFVLFTRKGMLFTIRIRRLRWMFFLGKESTQ